jgi:hypothetical protein
VEADEISSVKNMTRQRIGLAVLLASSLFAALPAVAGERHDNQARYEFRQDDRDGRYDRDRDNRYRDYRDVDYRDWNSRNRQVKRSIRRDDRYDRTDARRQDSYRR